jgi:glycosyltransferase involved in cell wall biosynthesis
MMFNRPGLSSKIRLIHHSVAVDQFRPGIAPVLEMRKRLGIVPHAVVVVCVAHLVPIKGHPNLIQALSQTQDNYLLVAGNPLDADYAAALEKLSCDLGLTNRIHFLGGIGDIPALLSETDIFVLPTLHRGEGCPVSLLEAMACGKACIATDVPGSRDLIVHGESGWLVPPEDPDALAHALRGLANDPGLRARLGQAARLRVVQHFTIEQEVVRHEHLYAEVLGL